MKKWYESKTLWVNAITFLVMALGAPELQALLGPGTVQVLAAIIAIANIGLRFLTNSPIENPLRK